MKLSEWCICDPLDNDKFAICTDNNELLVRNSWGLSLEQMELIVEIHNRDVNAVRNKNKEYRNI